MKNTKIKIKTSFALHLVEDGFDINGYNHTIQKQNIKKTERFSYNFFLKKVKAKES